MTASALEGSSVSLSGYPADMCKDKPCDPVLANKERMCSPDPSQPSPYDPFRSKPGWASTQWEAVGAVQSDPPPGLILYDADTCTGMSGSPVWQKTMVGGKENLALVAIHTGTHTRPNPKTGQNETFNKGIPLVAQLLHLLRQRMLCDREQARF